MLPVLALEIHLGVLPFRNLGFPIVKLQITPPVAAKNWAGPDGTILRGGGGRGISIILWPAAGAHQLQYMGHQWHPVQLKNSDRQKSRINTWQLINEKKIQNLKHRGDGTWGS